MSSPQHTYFGEHEIRETSSHSRDNISTMKVDENHFKSKKSSIRRQSALDKKLKKVSQDPYGSSSLDIITTEISQKKFANKKKVRNQYGQLIRPQSGKNESNMDLINELCQKSMLLNKNRREVTQSQKQMANMETKKLEDVLKQSNVSSPTQAEMSAKRVVYMKNKDQPAKSGLSPKININRDTMIMNIKTFDNLVNHRLVKKRNSSRYDVEIANLTKLPQKKSVIYNETQRQYKILVPNTPQQNQFLAMRSSGGSELLGDGSQHFKTQIRIAQAMVAPTDYQTEVSVVQNDVNQILRQQKNDLSAKRIFIDNLRYSQKAITVLNPQHNNAFMPNRGIISSPPNALRKRPITAKNVASRIAYCATSGDVKTSVNMKDSSIKNFQLFFDKVSQSSMESVKDENPSGQKMSMSKLKRMKANQVQEYTKKQKLQDFIKVKNRNMGSRNQLSALMESMIEFKLKQSQMGIRTQNKMMMSGEDMSTQGLSPQGSNINIQLKLESIRKNLENLPNNNDIKSLTLSQLNQVQQMINSKPLLNRNNNVYNTSSSTHKTFMPTQKILKRRPKTSKYRAIQNI